jgi:hypothetical protein
MTNQNVTSLGNLDQTESWLNRTWRPAAAVVYLAICLFDFIIAPAFMGFKTSNITQMAASLKDLDPSVAIALVQNRTPWVPLTMSGSGLFHVAFGAILGVAAWTRGNAQIEQIRQTGESDRSPNTPVMVPTYVMPSQVAQPSVNQMPVTQVNLNTGNAEPVSDDTTNLDNPDVEPDKY